MEVQMFRNQYTFNFVWKTQHPCMNNFIEMEVTQHPYKTSLMYSHCRDITEINTKYFGISKVVEVESVGATYMEAYERATTVLNTYLMSLQKNTTSTPDIEKPMSKQSFMESIESILGGIRDDIKETIKEKRK